MELLNGSKTKLLFVGIVLYGTFASPILSARQSPETLNNSKESSDVIISIAGHEHRYQPRPELGYVIVTQDAYNAIASVYKDINLFTQNEIKAVGGRDRQGLWIVERRQSAAQNKAAIKTLSAQRQVRYVAPLFSCNGETEAVIPEIVVKVTSGTQSEELKQICQTLNLYIKRRMMFTEQEYLVDVLANNADTIFDALTELNQIEFIEWAAPNTITQRRPRDLEVSDTDYSVGNVYLYNTPQNFSSTGFIPDDEYFPIQWHLHNTGQFDGMPDADINAPEAWEITTGDPNIVVAVQDTGVDLDHPDLFNNLIPGYDFYDDDHSPNTTDNAHGTACAGLVVAEGNNSIGVVGIANNCKVMPIRDGTGEAYVTWAETAEAIRWSAANGADVLSNSWGVDSPKPILHSAIVDVTKPGGIGRDGRGCVVCFAAGNSGGTLLSTDTAAYPEVIGVGATDQNDVRWSYSVYGPELDIVAPSGQRGKFLRANPDRWSNEASMTLSTDVTGHQGFSSDPAYKYGDELDYCFFGGTSGACPIAAGVAALILSVEPELTNEEVRHFLTRSAKDLGEPGRDDYYGWGRVDARAALDMVLAKRADLSNDWKVDFEDLLILVEFWGMAESSADIAPATKRDGIVDEQDLELMIQYWQTEIPEIGLIAHWKLDESEGDIAFESVYRKDGYLHGESLWQPTSGQVDGALEFDGSDDFISTDFVLNPSDGSFSVFAWIKGGKPGQVVISQTDGANWLLADPTSGNLMTELKGSGRGAAALLSQTSTVDGNWHKVGFVWDGSCRHLYVDGVEVASDAEPLSGLNDAYGGLYIGCGKGMEPGTYFSGLIDDVRIYNRVIRP